MKDAFAAFIRSYDMNGRMIGENLISQESSALSYLRKYMMDNGNIALKGTISPSKIAVRADGSVAKVLKAGDNITYTISVEPYLIDEGYSFVRGHDPELKGFKTVGEKIYYTDTEKHNLQVTHADEASLVQNIELMPWYKNETISLQHFFNTSITVPSDYFNLSAPLAIKATSGAYRSLILHLETPSISELFVGKTGEIVNVHGKLIKYSLEEETSPGNYVERVNKELDNPWAHFYQTLKIDVGTSFDSDDFFAARTGSRKFRMKIVIPNSGFWIEGSGNSLEWTKEFTVNAKDVDFKWEYSPHRLTLADPVAANWDASQGTLNLTAGQTFTFCFGNPYTPFQGQEMDYTLLNYVLWLESVDGGNDAFLEPISYADGCGTFAVTKNGRYRLLKLLAKVNGPWGEESHGLSYFDWDYIQVVGGEQGGIDTGGDGGVETQDEVIVWGGQYYHSSDFINAKFKAIATGDTHSLALKEDGTVVV